MQRIEREKGREREKGEGRREKREGIREKGQERRDRSSLMSTYYYFPSPSFHRNNLLNNSNESELIWEHMCNGYEL